MISKDKIFQVNKDKQNPGQPNLAGEVVQGAFQNKDDKVHSFHRPPINDENIFSKINEKKNQGDSVFEDSLLTQAYFSRYQLMDTSCTCVALMGVVLSAIEYELEYEQRLENEAKVILYAIFLSCILNAVFTIIRYNTFIDYKKVRKEYSVRANLFNTGLLVPCLLEFILVLIHPSPFLYGQKLKFVNEWAGPTGTTEVYYFYNEILSLLGILKLFLVLRTILTYTRWYSNRAYRVCQMYGVEPSLLFICKCSMKYSPYTFISVCYLVSILFFGFGVHISESALSRGNETGFNSYMNSFWCVIVTMTTVGYGDFYPYTLLGRFIIFIVCIIGTFITSLMVLSLTNTLETSILEQRAITVLDRLHTKEKRNKAAADAITQLAQLALFTSKSTQANYKQSHAQAPKRKKKLQKQIEQFMKYQDEYKHITDDNLIQELQRQFELIQKEMIVLKKEQQKMILKKIEIMKKLQMKQDIIDDFEECIDPDLNSDIESDDELSTDEELVILEKTQKSNYYKLTRQYTIQRQQTLNTQSQQIQKTDKNTNNNQNQQQKKNQNINIQINEPLLTIQNEDGQLLDNNEEHNY